jgi:2-dehydropantoate 2-reductase
VRYVVLGCGAIGGTIAAGLARDGHDVLVCDASQDVVSAVSARGITITGPVESFVVPERAVALADLPKRLDCVVLIAVKAHHTAAAAASIADRLADGGYVVSFQNGLNTSVLGEAIDPERVVAACVNFGADAVGPGVILRGNRATLMIGETDGTISDRVRALAADIADAEVTDNMLGYVWTKEAYGAMLAATALSDLPIADVLAEPRWAPLLTEIAREVLRQAPVLPVPLDGLDPADLDGSLERLAEFNRHSAKTHSGIYRDLAIIRRPTEVPAILGGLAGESAPLVRRVLELIAAIEARKRTCGRANLELLTSESRGLDGRSTRSRGIFPLSPRCDHAGTLTATVSGAAELLAVLAGRAKLANAADLSGSGAAAGAAKLAGAADRDGADGPAPFTVGVLAAQLADPSVTSEVAESVGAAIAALTAEGWEIREVRAPWLDQLARWEETLAVIVAREAHLVHAGRDTRTYSEGTLALLEYGAKVTDEQFALAQDEQSELTAAIDSSLSGVDVLAGPTVGYQAPEEDPPFGVGDENAESRFTGPYNMTGHPALSLPVSAAGLPVGLQLAGRRGADQAVLTVAAAVERVIGVSHAAVASAAAMAHVRKV